MEAAPPTNVVGWRRQGWRRQVVKITTLLLLLASFAAPATVGGNQYEVEALIPEGAKDVGYGTFALPLDAGGLVVADRSPGGALYLTEAMPSSIALFTPMRLPFGAVTPGAKITGMAMTTSNDLFMCDSQTAVWAIGNLNRGSTSSHRVDGARCDNSTRDSTALVSRIAVVYLEETAPQATLYLATCTDDTRSVNVCSIQPDSLDAASCGIITRSFEFVGALAAVAVPWKEGGGSLVARALLAVTEVGPSGSLFVYALGDDPSTTQIELVANKPLLVVKEPEDSYSHYGFALALSATHAYVGARGNQISGGCIFAYRLDGPASQQQPEGRFCKPTTTGLGSQSFLGLNLALSTDGSTLVAAAQLGAVTFFTQDSYDQLLPIKSFYRDSGPPAAGTMERSVAASANYVFVGNPQSGEVLVFANTQTVKNLGVYVGLRGRSAAGIALGLVVVLASAICVLAYHNREPLRRKHVRLSDLRLNVFVSSPGLENAPEPEPPAPQQPRFPAFDAAAAAADPRNVLTKARVSATVDNPSGWVALIYSRPEGSFVSGGGDAGNGNGNGNSSERSSTNSSITNAEGEDTPSAAAGGAAWLQEQSERALKYAAVHRGRRDDLDAPQPSAVPVGQEQHEPQQGLGRAQGQEREEHGGRAELAQALRVGEGEGEDDCCPGMGDEGGFFANSDVVAMRHFLRPAGFLLALLSVLQLGVGAAVSNFWDGDASGAWWACLLAFMAGVSALWGQNRAAVLAACLLALLNVPVSVAGVVLDVSGALYWSRAIACGSTSRGRTKVVYESSNADSLASSRSVLLSLLDADLPSSFDCFCHYGDSTQAAAGLKQDVIARMTTNAGNCTTLLTDFTPNVAVSATLGILLLLGTISLGVVSCLSLCQKSSAPAAILEAEPTAQTAVATVTV